MWVQQGQWLLHADSTSAMSNTIYRQLPIEFNLVAPNSMFSFLLLKRKKKKRLENHFLKKKLPHGNILLDGSLNCTEISLNCIKYFLSFTYMQLSFFDIQN